MSLDGHDQMQQAVLFSAGQLLWCIVRGPALHLNGADPVLPRVSILFGCVRSSSSSGGNLALIK